PSPFPHGQMRNGAEELFALAFWEMTIVVEVILTTVVDVGMPASTASRPWPTRLANEPEMLLEPIKMWPVSVAVTAATIGVGGARVGAPIPPQPAGRQRDARLCQSSRRCQPNLGYDKPKNKVCSWIQGISS